MGGGVIDVTQKVSGTSTTFQLTTYRGDGVANNQGGADSDGATPLVGNQSLIIIELNDSAELIRTNGLTTSQDLNVSANLPISGTENFEVGTSFQTNALIVDAIEVLASNKDGLFGANIGAASYSVANGVRLQSKLEISNSSTIEPIFHGNYGRGNQGTTDTFGYSLNLAGFVFLEQNNEIKFANTLTGQNGTFKGQALWMSAWGINLDTLIPPSVDVSVNANLQTANFSLFGVTVSTQKNIDVSVGLQIANFSIQNFTVSTQTDVDVNVNLQIANFSLFGVTVTTIGNVNVGVALQQANFTLQSFTVQTQSNVDVTANLQIATFNIFFVTVVTAYKV